MNAKWIGAIAAITCAIIGFGGGVLGHKFITERAIYLERLDNINSLRSETYLEFFEAMSKLEQARQFGYASYGDFSKNPPEDDELAARLKDVLWEYHLNTKEARMKLAAFGPTELVHNLANYYRERYAPRPCTESWRRDVLTYLAMRKELLADIEEKDVEPEEMFLLMWNCDPRISKAENEALPLNER